MKAVVGEVMPPVENRVLMRQARPGAPAAKRPSALRLRREMVTSPRHPRLGEASHLEVAAVSEGVHRDYGRRVQKFLDYCILEGLPLVDDRMIEVAR